MFLHFRPAHSLLSKLKPPTFKNFFRFNSTAPTNNPNKNHNQDTDTEDTDMFEKIRDRKSRLKKFSDYKEMTISIKALILSLFFSAGIYTYLNMLEDEAEKNLEYRQKRELHLSKIGGPIELVNTENQLTTEEQFKGNFSLLYFGFTHCPDVCPDTLDRIDDIVKELDKAGIKKPNLVFISVDPQRDTPSEVKEYLADFNSNFVGLTGTVDQVCKVTTDFRIFFSSGPKDEDEDYLVDHTSLIYFMNPSWKFIDYYALDIPLKETVERIKRHIERYYLTN